MKFISAHHFNIVIIFQLLRQKADVNFTNEHGNSPLHYACFWGYNEIAEDLVNNGAIVSIANKFGDTPLDKAKGNLAKVLHDIAVEVGQDLKKIKFKDQSWLGLKTRSIQSLVARMKTSEALAKQKASDVANLQILNSLIVEQMPAGALLVNKTGQIIMANNEAHHLLDEPLLDGLLVAHIFPELFTAIKQWLNNPKLELQPLQPSKKHVSKLRPTLIRSKHSNQLVILVFLESTDVIAKQVQQIKLASLGHLTASIAHEIRNPLGALSHAVQLLKESENMDRSASIG